MESLEIVRAIPADAAELSLVSRAAKAHWGYSAAALEEWGENLLVTSKFIAGNEVFKAIAGAQTVGFYALHRVKRVWRLEHLWVFPDWIGHGAGAALFRHAVARAAELGVTRLTIESDPNAEGFYLHMGARRVGTLHTQMEGKARELPLLEIPIAPA
ncbi:MAG: GNAT family N-acetyltransferase [Chthoniobacterales bacterium]|nr:GNAT family N-acetyltransferase [Chthoniobacterales bacterium]